jgi:hypothetical protein
MKLKQQSDIPSDWKVLKVRKKTTVKIRPCNGVEYFKVSWSESELVSDPEKDLIVITPIEEYPCNESIFWSTYIPADRWGSKVNISDYNFAKNVTTTIVEIPEDVEPFEVETLEGVVGGVAHPDYVAIGAKGELYVNVRSFVESDLEIVG